MSLVSSRRGGARCGRTTRGAACRLTLTDPPMASLPAPGVGAGAVATIGVDGIAMVGSSCVPLQATVKGAMQKQAAAMTVRRIVTEPRSHACDELFHPLVDRAERVLAQDGA